MVSPCFPLFCVCVCVRCVRACVVFACSLLACSGGCQASRGLSASHGLPQHSQVSKRMIKICQNFLDHPSKNFKMLGMSRTVQNQSKNFCKLKRPVFHAVFSSLFLLNLRNNVWLGRAPRGSCNRTLLRRVLRRLSNSKCFLEGFLEGACKGFQ